MKQNLLVYYLFISFIFFDISVSGQSLITRQKKIIFRDTVGEFIQTGNIQPTGIIKTADSSYLISTNKHIYFKDYWKRNQEFDYEFHKKIHSKEQINSSVIKLDSNFHKVWEKPFTDRYVSCISNGNSNENLLSGSFILENKIWIGDISLDGKLLWEQIYRMGYKPRIIKQIVNGNGDIVVLGSRTSLSWFRLYPNKKIKFFKENLKGRLFIAYFDNKGKKKWIKKIDDRKYDLNPIDISITKNNCILLSESFRCNEKWGTRIVLLNPNGKIKWETDIEKSELFLNSINDEIVCSGYIDSTLCVQFMDYNGKILTRNNLATFIPNRVIMCNWINSDKSGFIWTYNNKLYKFQIENKNVIWENIPIKLEYIFSNNIIKSFDNSYIITGYRYLNPNKPLDIGEYSEIIEIK